MADRSEVRAGIFVAVALVVLAAGTLWIVGAPMAGDQSEFEVQMASSGGVRRGDRVRLSGLEVGRVKSIELTPGEELPVVFYISVDDTVRLTDGATARLTTDGLLGAPYLELVAGSPTAQPLRPGTRIIGRETSDLNEALGGLGAATDRLPVLLDRATDLVTKVDSEIGPLLTSLRRLLSDENVDRVSRVLAQLEPTVEEVGTRLSTLAEHLDDLAGELEEGLGGLPELTDEVRGLVGDLRTALGPEGSRLSTVLESADQTLGTADGALTSVELNRDEIDAMIRDLREASANLRSLTQTLKERPALLLRKPEMPERQPGEGENP